MSKKQKRDKKGHSRKSLAILYGVTEKTITRWKKTGHLDKIKEEEEKERLKNEYIKKLKTSAEFQVSIEKLVLESIEEDLIALKGGEGLESLPAKDKFTARIKLYEVLGKING